MYIYSCIFLFISYICMYTPYFTLPLVVTDTLLYSPTYHGLGSSRGTPFEGLI